MMSASRRLREPHNIQQHTCSAALQVIGVGGVMRLKEPAQWTSGSSRPDREPNKLITEQADKQTCFISVYLNIVVVCN